MNVYKNSIWLTYHKMYQMEDIHQFISVWSKLLENKKEHDFQQIAYRDDEQSFVDDYFLTNLICMEN